MKKLKFLLSLIFLLPFSSCKEVTSTNEKSNLKGMDSTQAVQSNTLTPDQIESKRQEIEELTQQLVVRDQESIPQNQEEGKETIHLIIGYIIDLLSPHLQPENVELARDIRKNLETFFPFDKDGLNIPPKLGQSQEVTSSIQAKSNPLDERTLRQVLDNIHRLFGIYNSIFQNLEAQEDTDLQTQLNSKNVLMFVLSYFIREHAQKTKDKLEDLKTKYTQIQNESIDRIIDLFDMSLSYFNPTKIQKEIRDIYEINQLEEGNNLLDQLSSYRTIYGNVSFEDAKRMLEVFKRIVEIYHPNIEEGRNPIERRIER